MKYIKFLVFILTVSAMVYSCGNSTEPEKTAKEYAAEGWDSFAKGNYETAEKSFLNAVKADGKLADAYSGAGWSIAYQRDRQSEAIAQWKMGVNNQAVNADLYAGLTIVYQALDTLDKCVDAGNEVVALDNNYIFEHDAHITIHTIYGLMAAANYGLQNYAAAASEMDLAVPADAPHSDSDLKKLLDSIMWFLGLN